MTNKKSCKKFSEHLKQNYWISTTAILAILLVASVFTGTSCTGAVISAETAGNNVVQFALDQGAEATLVGVVDTGSLYEVTISISGEEATLYTTYDGENLVPYIYSLSELAEETTASTTETSNETILECGTDYGLTEDTIIFYYSDSCGWCSKMKPGVDVLEENGYNILRIEASEGGDIINNCVRSHMTSSGIPQFVCVKTGEIHTGAFAYYDESGSAYLDQEAMNEWVEECLA